MSPRSRKHIQREAVDWVRRLRDPSGAGLEASFRSWYEADPAHAEAYEEASEAYAVSGLLARTELGRRRSLASLGTRRAHRSTYAVAAVFAAVVVFAAFVVSSHGLTPFARPEARTMLLASMLGEIREVPLPDGSKVTLDTNSKLRVAFNAAERRLVLERGRARFYVAQEKRPFKVRAGKVEVVATSTTFDVSREDTDTVVLLIEGRVEVASSVASDAPGTPSRPLQRGQKLSVTGSQLVLGAPSAGELNWPSGMLRFENATLEEVISEANRYSSSALQLADPRLRLLRVSGAYRAGDNEALASSLAAAFDLKVRRAPGGGYLLSRVASPQH